MQTAVHFCLDRTEWKCHRYSASYCGVHLYKIISGFTTIPPKPEASEAFDTVLVRRTEWLQELRLKEDRNTTAILKGL